MDVGLKVRFGRRIGVGDVVRPLPVMGDGERAPVRIGD